MSSGRIKHVFYYQRAVERRVPEIVYDHELLPGRTLVLTKTSRHQPGHCALRPRRDEDVREGAVHRAPERPESRSSEGVGIEHGKGETLTSTGKRMRPHLGMVLV